MVKKLLWYDDIKKTPITMMNIVLGIIVVISLNLKFSKQKILAFRGTHFTKRKFKIIFQYG